MRVLLIGIALIVIGIKIRRYYPGRLVTKSTNNIIDYIANKRYIRKFISWLANTSNNPLHRLTKAAMDKSETLVSIESIYVIKLIAMFTMITLLIAIKLTNFNALKTTFFDDIAIYPTSAFSSKQSLDHLQIATITDKFTSFTNAIASYKSINFGDVMLVLISFWGPEIFIVLKRFLMNGRHKQEMIKLESVFELLGTVKSFKTINVLDEMCEVSKLYKQNIKLCRDKFLIDKENALEQLKASVRAKRFKKLVDYIRIYAFVDKTVAIEVLERNRMQGEEDMILTADEDVDFMDLVAFCSVLPILLQLTELLLKPMMSTVIKSFNFI